MGERKKRRLVRLEHGTRSQMFIFLFHLSYIDEPEFTINGTLIRTRLAKHTSRTKYQIVFTKESVSVATGRLKITIRSGRRV